MATARLLRRTGFGATGPQIDAVARQDWSSYLDTVLSLNPDADPGALATPRPTATTPTDPGTARQQQALKPQLFQQMKDLTEWWLRLCCSDDPRQRHGLRGGARSRGSEL